VLAPPGRREIKVLYGEALGLFANVEENFEELCCYDATKLCLLAQFIADQVLRMRLVPRPGG
jgi:hypothetical protein